MDLSHLKMYSQWIKKEYYDIHRYWMPFGIDKKLKFLRKYFRVMDKDVSQKFKRRKNPVEIGEAAIMILGRIDQLLRMDVAFTVGSRFLSPVPWALFGEAHNINAVHFFRDMEDIANNYIDLIMSGGASPEYFHFRISPQLPTSLAHRYKQTPHFMMAIAICLLYDLVVECGPDSPEIYDLYTNDLRESYDEIDIERWEDLRCNVMGRHGKIKNKAYKYKLGQIYEPRVPLVSETKIDLMDEDNDISYGERVIIMKRPTFAMPTDDEWDDGTVALEADQLYTSRVRKNAVKYSYLGLSLNV